MELLKFFSRNQEYRPPEIKGGRTAPLPEDVDWWIHRIASSTKYSSGLIEIQTQWSLLDVLDAHQVLDVYAVLEAPEKSAK